MLITEYKDQVENIENTIKWAASTFVHASGVLGFTPTRKTYERECPCCGTIINTQRCGSQARPR